MTPDAGSSAEPAGPVLSPALADGAGQAFELKFLLPADRAGFVESWARRWLRPDPHGLGGAYRILSLYCDTPGLDVYHRAPGYRRRKYRLRRYGLGGLPGGERESAERNGGTPPAFEATSLAPRRPIWARRFTSLSRATSRSSTIGRLWRDWDRLFATLRHGFCSLIRRRITWKIIRMPVGWR